jgi:translation initiation factor 1 (eIF-1/SUI1)
MADLFERYDPTKELEETLSEKINIYNMGTHGRKSLTVITGLVLDKDEEKLFLTKGKEKFSTSGYRKLIKEYDNKNDSYCFNGDKRLECKELIMKLFDKSDSVFNIH